MKALTLVAPSTFEFGEAPAPTPERGQVLVDVKACGICGSDLHGMDGRSGRRIPPIIMGHEAAGEIVSLGEGVTQYKVGDRVTFDSTEFCGECPDCKAHLSDRKSALQAMLGGTPSPRAVVEVAVPDVPKAAAPKPKSEAKPEPAPAAEKRKVAPKPAPTAVSATSFTKPAMYAMGLAVVLIGMNVMGKAAPLILGPKAAASALALGAHFDGVGAEIAAENVAEPRQAPRSTWQRGRPCDRGAFLAREREGNVRPRHRETPHHFADRFCFGAVRLEKLQPRGRGIEQVVDLDAGAVRERGFLRSAIVSSLRFHQWSGFDVRYPADRGLAVRTSNPKLHCLINLASGPSILTFANTPAAIGCEC